jgi:hypothetical protein
MTTRKPAFKPGLRDQQRAVKSAMEGMARLHGVKLPEGALSDVKPKITRGPRMAKDTKPESEVQSEIIDYLVRHPKVALVVRINAGAVFNANDAFIKFHHIFIPHQFKKSKIEKVDLKVSDLTVIMIDGKFCAIEVKEESWVKPCNEREYAQQRYLNHIDAHKGIAFFAASVDDVRKNLILNGY